MTCNLIEALESRTLLSADVNVSFARDHSRDFAGELTRYDRRDLYAFRLSDRGNVNVWLRGLDDDADVELRNADGQRIDASRKDGRRAERLSVSLPKGRYQVRVFQGDHGAKTAYDLRITADENWGRVGSGDDRRRVGLVFGDGSTGPIRSNRRTWVVIHGWNGQPSDLSRLTDAIEGYSKRDQVLVLDWSRAAAAPDPFDAFTWIDDAGAFAAQKLEGFGLSASRINLVGHSFGAYVAAETAGGLHNGANVIVALDPAASVPFYNFRANSRYSLGLVGSVLGSESRAATADDAFRVNAGSGFAAHTNIVDLYASMVAENNTSNPDHVSKLFSLDRLNAGASRPWDRNAFSGGFEGTLNGEVSGGHWVPESLVYRDNGQRVTVRA
jgi:pimeloyl-ACP methyl ester carboxylesterase